MTVLRHKKPCKACPWRRASAPGWLGRSTPQEFLAQARGDVHMPCHKAIDYERADWKKQATKAPHCAGSLVFLRNICHLPRDAELVARRNAVEADRKSVFATPQEFLDHHANIPVKA